MEVSNIEIKFSILSASPISSHPSLQPSNTYHKLFQLIQPQLAFDFQRLFVILSAQILSLIRDFYILQSCSLQTFLETFFMCQWSIISCCHTYFYEKYACMPISIDFRINNNIQVKLNWMHFYLSQFNLLQHKPFNN